MKVMLLYSCAIVAEYYGDGEYYSSFADDLYDIDTKLPIGLKITIVPDDTNDCDKPSLSLGFTDLIEIKRRTAPGVYSDVLANTLIAGQLFDLMYDGTYWTLIETSSTEETNKFYIQNTEPTDAPIGSFWIDTSNNTSITYAESTQF